MIATDCRWLSCGCVGRFSFTNHHDTHFVQTVDNVDMSQPSVTASENSDYFSRSRSQKEPLERSLDDDKDEEYEFEDLVHHLAESFISYKRRELVLCDYNHAARMKSP